MKDKRHANLREGYLDGEKLFRYYWEVMRGEKSVRLLAEWAITEGMRSSKGGEPTPMGVWKAMWRWASLHKNHLIAWEIISKVNPKLTWEEWVKDMIEAKIPSAWQHPTISKYHKFLRDNRWTNGS